MGNERGAAGGRRVLVTVRAATLWAAVALGGVGTAAAAELATDTILVRGDQFAVCTATNVGKTGIVVTIDVIQPDVGSVNGASTCDVGPDEICLQEIQREPGIDRFLLCRVKSSGGKVRAALMDPDSGVTSQAR
jgi:hypothetical protein